MSHPQSHPSLPPTSPYSIQDEESPSQESEDDNNPLDSPQLYDDEYIDNSLLAEEIFGNEFNFDFDDAWAPDEEFNFESLPPELPSPAPFLPQPPGSPPHLPPSNQHAINIPRPLPPTERPQIIHNAFRFADSDPFAEYLDFTPPPPSATPHSFGVAASARTTRQSSVVDLTGSPPAEMAPALRDRKRKERGSGSRSEDRPTKVAKTISKNAKPPNPNPNPKTEDADVIDLVDIEDGMQYKDFQAKQQAEAIKQQNLDEATRPVKLAEFQCIICMDNPTDLTVTHCGKSEGLYNSWSLLTMLGHLFCSECLHQALHAGNGKKACPVCRTVIVIPKPGQKTSKNGMFALEMKLMTANKKGKQPVRAN